MTMSDDEVDMSDSNSKFVHLYNPYLSYVEAKLGAIGVGVAGCTANIDAKTIQLSWIYTIISLI